MSFAQVTTCPHCGSVIYATPDQPPQPVDWPFIMRELDYIGVALVYVMQHYPKVRRVLHKICSHVDASRACLPKECLICEKLISHEEARAHRGYCAGCAHAMAARACAA
jgi:hypothetical protein